MNKSVLIYLILSLILNINCLSQKLIQGTVYDESGILSYCSIYFQEHVGIGTSTTEEGKYVLPLQDSLVTDTIIFSSVGHYKHKISAKDLIENPNIFLQSKVLLLNEVEIISFKDSIGSILVNTFENYSNIFPDKKHQLRGYFQEYTYNKDSIFLYAVESDLFIEDYAYKDNTDNIKISINELRRTEDKRARNIVYFTKKLFPHQVKINTIFRAYENPLRCHKEPYKRFGQNFTNYRDFTLISYTKKGNGSTSEILVKYEYLGNTDSDYSYGYITINLEDLRIKKLEDYKYNGNLYYTLIVFKNISGKNYPSRIKIISPSIIDNLSEISVSTIMFYDIKTESFDKISKRKLLSRDKYLHELNITENEEFWLTYPYDNLNPIDPKILLSIKNNKPYNIIDE